MTMTEEPVRTDECPWWCAGHWPGLHDPMHFAATGAWPTARIDLTQPNSTLIQTVGHEEDEGFPIAYVTVSCQTPAAPIVSITLDDAIDVDFAPTEARQLAEFLLGAADLAESTEAPA